jgi:hypothetical protein
MASKDRTPSNVFVGTIPNPLSLLTTYQTTLEVDSVENIPYKEKLTTWPESLFMNGPVRSNGTNRVIADFSGRAAGFISLLFCWSIYKSGSP